LDSQARVTNMMSPQMKELLDSHARVTNMISPQMKELLDSHARVANIISPQMKELLDSHAKVANIISPQLKELLGSQARVANMISPQMKELLDSQARMGNLISRELVFDNWVKTNTQLFALIQRRISIANCINSEILPMLEKYNWFLTVSLGDAFISDLSRLIQNSSEKLPIVMREHFINYFSRNNYKNLHSMVKSWEENLLFKPRIKILKDTCNLLKHSHDSYNPANVLIPVLIAQIDGILTDYLIQNEFTIEQEGKGLVWKDKTNKPVCKVSSRNKIFEQIFDSNCTDYSIASSSISPTALEIGNDFILSTLFQTAFTKQKLKKPFGLNRHKIMHGEYVKYGRIEHLIRTYLVLDFLYGLENVDHNNTTP